MSDQITLTIDDQQVTVPAGSTVLQAAKQLQKEIPHFCYHEKLTVAGNCRMCLVEVEGAPKPVASCHWPAAEGMVVRTQSETTVNAQKGTMEMLLINHPLDCPICDQGGECDLQDIAVAYGSDRTRFSEMKRAVDDRDIGAKIKTVMTRCIHCTRCIRFATEIAGVEEMGATGRGENMEVGTYVEKALVSELAGNMVDICPVGALTNKPYAFKARPWELESTASIDVMDALGSNIQVDHRAGEVMRILPRENEAVNECWIADTARYCWDAFSENRLTAPLVADKRGALRASSWPQAFEAVQAATSKAKPTEIGVLIGGNVPAEGLFALQQWLCDLGVPAGNINAAPQWNGYKPASRAHYTLNTAIADFEKADAVLMIGADPRYEAPLLNLRIRKNVLKNATPVGVIGAPIDPTYATEWLGDKATTITEIAKAKSGFAKVLKQAKKPLILIGAAAQSRADAGAVVSAAAELAKACGAVGGAGWNGFNVLPQTAGQVAALDIFSAPKTSVSKLSSSKVLIVYGDVPHTIKPEKGQTVIYLGSHRTAQANAAHIVLPTALYTEQTGLWTNAEGRVQEALQAVKPPLQAKEDWKIWRALSAVTGKALPFNTLAQLREQLVSAHSAYGQIGERVPAEWTAPTGSAKLAAKAFGEAMPNFYQSNSIMQASKVLKECRIELKEYKNNQHIKKAS